MVLSISAIGKGTIFRKDNLFVATKPESGKQSEESESTNLLKANGTSDKQRVACSDLDVVADAAPRYRVGSLACLMQSILRGMKGLLVFFFDVQV